MVTQTMQIPSAPSHHHDPSQVPIPSPLGPQERGNTYVAGVAMLSWLIMIPDQLNDTRDQAIKAATDWQIR